MSSSMDFEYDPKVLDYLEALDKKYTCLICNGFLTCARIIECGHAYCAYCLDILESTKSTCPVCDHSIRPAVPAPQIDREVEEMLQYCSGDLYAAYQKAKASRIEKQKERSKTLKELADSIYAKEDKSNPSKNYKRARNMEEVCTKLAENVANRPVNDIIPDSFINPNKRRSEQVKQQTRMPSKPKSKTGLQSSRSIHNEACGTTGNPEIRLLDTTTGLDVPKVDALFEMYDHLLRSPPDSGGSGDADHESLTPRDMEIPTSSRAVENEEMTAIRQKIQQEIELLVKDTEEAVDLYEFVNKWTDQIRDVALGAKERQIEEEVRCTSNTNDSLMPIEWVDELGAPALEDGSPRTLDDVAAEELWKTSVELIKRWRDSKGRKSMGCLKIPDPSRLSSDPEWNTMNLDTSIDIVSKSITTQFDDEYMQLLELDRLRESSKFTRHSNIDNEDNDFNNEHQMNFNECITNDDIEFFHKILRCKSALNDLREKSKSATDPQQIRSLLPVQEFKESRTSKSQTNMCAEQKHFKSELWIPEIEESGFQHYSQILQSRSVAFPSTEKFGTHPERSTSISKTPSQIHTPRQIGRQKSLPSPRPQRSSSGRLSGRQKSPLSSRKSSFK